MYLKAGELREGNVKDVGYAPLMILQKMQAGDVIFDGASIPMVQDQICFSELPLKEWMEEVSTWKELELELETR